MEVKVTVEGIDLAAVVGERYDGHEGRVPFTLGEAIAQEVMNALKQTEEYRTMTHKIVQQRDEEIREQLRPIITEAITQQVQPTNKWGDPAGSPTTLRDQIVKTAQEILTKRDSYGSRPLVDKIIREEVGRAFESELREAIKVEKEKVVASVRAKAAELIAEAVKGGIGR